MNIELLRILAKLVFEQSSAISVISQKYICTDGIDRTCRYLLLQCLVAQSQQERYGG
jgi:hypothetical protein